MSKIKRCKWPGCTAERNSRWSDGYCLDHAVEAEVQEMYDREHSPRGIAEAALDDCTTFDDLKDWLRDNCLPQEE